MRLATAQLGIVSSVSPPRVGRTPHITVHCPTPYTSKLEKQQKHHLFIIFDPITVTALAEDWDYTSVRLE